MTDVVICALYKFVTLDDYRDLQGPLRQFCNDQGIKGTLLLANEGINGTVAGSRQAIDALLSYLKRDVRFADIEHKEALEAAMPFYRMRVRLKKEIVKLAVDGIDPNREVGRYVEPQDWNALISDPDVVLVDTRNDYEVAIGTFEGAIDPDTQKFTEFPDYVSRNLDPGKHKKVAMFCTGGIRCEKASAYMLAQGFDEVYHLKGGILNYLEKVEPADSLWQGECYVFDNRVAVDHALQKGSFEQCHGCRMPLSEEDRQSPHYEPGVCCHRCYQQLSPSQRERFAERHRQVQLAKRRGEQHLGKSYDAENFAEFDQQPNQSVSEKS